MKIAFAGTPKFARDILDNLINKGYNISFVLTQSDKPSGRGMKMTKSEVKQSAVENNIPIYQPLSLKLDGKDAILAAQIHEELKQVDILIVVAYGLLLPKSIVEKFYCINIHPSILPKWRGAAPIQRAIQAGDTKTGVCIMHMDAGLDTGNILYMQNNLTIEKTDTSLTLAQKLNVLSNSCLEEVLKNFDKYKNKAIKQDTQGITYAGKILKQETILDLNKTADELSQSIRAFSPAPACKINEYKIYNAVAVEISQYINPHQNNGIILSLNNGIIVTCNNGKQAINILEIQAPNKKPMHYSDFIQTFNLQVGQKLF